ncbi:MAG: hypothetical protein H6810_05510 [Phycisphaeraceae bacterium]|nr:MAG: hypothetical protein H6810_05510 [Phycisphaeraceae bacterium]
MFKHTTFAIVVFAAAGSAFAGPVLFDFEGVGQGRGVYIESDGGHVGNVFAGSVKHKVDGDLLYTYCINPDQGAQTGVRTFERTQIANAISQRPYAQEKAAAIAELADAYGATLFASNASQDMAAAFQVSVWEILKDFDPNAGNASFDFTSGSFRASGNSTIFTQATSMLSALNFNRVDSLGYIAYAHDSYQDFMGQSVPAPGALALSMVGLPLCGSRRRRA